MKRTSPTPKYVVCIENEGCEDLALNKIYEVAPDASALKSGFIRMTDESGEDYLYPAEHFIAIKLPQQVEKALVHAS